MNTILQIKTWNNLNSNLNLIFVSNIKKKFEIFSKYLSGSN